MNHNKYSAINGSKRTYLLERQKLRCFYCGISLRKKSTADHVVPVSRGGTDCVANLVMACTECNQAKGTLSAIEFGARPERLAELGIVIERKFATTRATFQRLATPADWQISIARAICREQGVEPDAKIYLDMKEVKAWEARLPLVKAAYVPSVEYRVG